MTICKQKKYDIAIVGAGILGTFIAYHAVQKGLQTLLIEKDAFHGGASVRNFGQLIPSGQSLDKWRIYGIEGLDVFSRLIRQEGAPIKNEGSFYVASDEDEMTLINELQQLNEERNYRSKILSAKEALEKQPALSTAYVKGAIFFPQEFSVNPITFMPWFISYLKSFEQFNYLPLTTVVECVDKGECVKLGTLNADVPVVEADYVFVCPGSEKSLLYPRLFMHSDLPFSKLQMMRVLPEKPFRVYGNLLTGYSIRRYDAFKSCPSYDKITAQFKNERLEKDYGIHILAKQETDGSFILGDSHFYTNAQNVHEQGFKIDELINELMLEESRKIFSDATFRVIEKWYGVYTTNHEGVLIADPEKNVRFITGLGGKGMTVSAGLAKEQLEKMVQR